MLSNECSKYYGFECLFDLDFGSEWIINTAGLELCFYVKEGVTVPENLNVFVTDELSQGYGWPKSQGDFIEPALLPEALLNQSNGFTQVLT